MSWLPDPFQAAQPPTVELIEEELEEPRDYHDYFWDDIRYSQGRDAVRDSGMHMETCRFDENGDHVTMAEHCPHFDVEDETGKRIQPGWTVQQGR